MLGVVFLKSIKKFLSAALIIPMVLSFGITGVFAVPANSSSNTNTSKDIKIFFTNDVHGRALPEYKDGDLSVMGYAKAKGYINQQDAGGKLIFDIGNSYQGNSFAAVDNGEGLAKIMNAFSYDAVVTSNHDFDYGLKQLQKLYSITKSQALSVNTKQNDKLLFKQYTTTTINGVKVGIFGVTTPHTAENASKFKDCDGVTFGDKDSIIKDVNSTVNTLKQKEKCSLIIALSHVGINDDPTFTSKDIAEANNNIDVILDGCEQKVYTEQVNSTYITSAGYNFENMGEVDVNISGSKKDINCKTIKANDIKDVTPDKDVEAAVSQVKESQDKIKNTVVGKTPVELDGKTTSTNETTLTKLTGAAFIDKSGADISIINSGLFKESIPAGDITKGQILDAMPSGNNLVTVKMTGRQIVDQIDKIFEQGNDIPLVSGMNVSLTRSAKYDSSGTKDIYIVNNVYFKGQPIELDKSYSVATTDYLAQGNAGYSVMKDAKVGSELGLETAAVEEYLPKANFTDLAAQKNLIFEEKSDSSAVQSVPTNQMHFKNFIQENLITILIIVGAILLSIILIIIVLLIRKKRLRSNKVIRKYKY
jgi:5'-nucleotidase